MASMLNFVCILVLSPWGSVTFPPCEEIMIPLEEDVFGFWDISQFIFGVRAISSRKLFLVTFTPVEDSSVVEMLMMLRCFPAFSRLAATC